MEDTWTMEEATNDFNAVAEAAYTGKPQYVINHSNPDLVITAKSGDKNLGVEEKEKKSFIEFLLSCPRGDLFPDEDASTDITEGCKETGGISPGALENADKSKKPSFKELLFSIPKGEPFIDENGRDELKLRDVEF